MTPEARCQRALKLGLCTWLCNAASCALAVVPLALPLSVALLVINQVSGALAMIEGVRGWRACRDADRAAARDALVGLGLGAIHLVVSVVFGAVLLLMASELGLLPR